MSVSKRSNLCEGGHSEPDSKMDALFALWINLNVVFSSTSSEFFCPLLSFSFLESLLLLPTPFFQGFFFFLSPFFPTIFAFLMWKLLHLLSYCVCFSGLLSEWSRDADWENLSTFFFLSFFTTFSVTLLSCPSFSFNLLSFNLISHYPALNIQLAPPHFNITPPTHTHRSDAHSYDFAPTSADSFISDQFIELHLTTLQTQLIGLHHEK